MGSDVPGGGGGNPAGGGTWRGIGMIGMIIPPEVVGPATEVGSQIALVDRVVNVTPGLLDAAGELEVI